ncbi:ribosomal RNA large subunit methyltransferase M [Ktedonobacter sp. SOSP1-85]|uniref:SAM-dependent methyltransferase n=1 Tax=Ktedonobacter sp. SOSP1-85 TaxID=2778367 RepID=UPI00191595F7|nr:SAM-dependent methyltransferase [Ktedonobacter sp. SOSP1-85]GHO73088.1 ribosomal RNA large subunit methyltransferase M [Ktedonobacter sp. SOSP1-85]
MSSQNTLLITTQPEFTQAAIDELRILEKQIEVLEELVPGILHCSVPDSAVLMRRASQAQLIFVRHLAPVQDIVALHNSEQDLGNIATAIAELPGFVRIERGIHFAVQTRFIQTDKQQSKRPYSSGMLNRELAMAFAEETGAIEDIKKPEVVVSLLCASHQCYVGISNVEDNLSSWPGGARHYAQTEEQISRAEFKLLEALEVFHITLPEQGKALDLGAAPGGWTRLLLNAGLDVVAVDPANLDPRLRAYRGLEHYQGYTERYLDAQAQLKHFTRFDLIVNDMKMDAREAARLLVRASAQLRPEGFIISVFKLPHATETINPLKTVNEALKTMRKHFNIVRAHQLFHNRQEITVAAAQPLPTRR